MGTYQKGDRVYWTYIHAYGGRGGRARRVKRGTVHHYCKEGGILNGIVAVKFDHNKTFSRVPSSELKSLAQLKEGS